MITEIIETNENEKYLNICTLSTAGNAKCIRFNHDLMRALDLKPGGKVKYEKFPLFKEVRIYRKRYPKSPRDGYSVKKSGNSLTASFPDDCVNHLGLILGDQVEFVERDNKIWIRKCST